MRKELLKQFEELELFAESVENAIEKARVKTEYALDLRLYAGGGQYDIFSTAECDIAGYNEMLNNAKRHIIDAHINDTFIDIYENTPAEAVYAGVTIWLHLENGIVKTTID